MLKHIVLLSLIFVSGTGIYRTSLALSDNKNEEMAFKLDPPPLTNLPVKFIDVLTLGFRPLYDNLLEIWILQYLMDQRSFKTSPELIAANIEKALRPRPKREGLYVLICAYFHKHLNRPDLCEKSSLVGLSVMPESWKISMMQAHIYLINDEKAKAATLYLNAASLKNSPPYLKSLGTRLAKDENLSKNEYQELIQGLEKLPGVQSFLRLQNK